MSELSRAVGTSINILRRSSGLSQEELAGKAGLHRTYIGQVERGEKNITLSSLHTITQALEISLGEFFMLVEPNKSTSIRRENSYPTDSSNTAYLPFQDFIEILQNSRAIDQKRILEALKFMVKWASYK